MSTVGNEPSRAPALPVERVVTREVGDPGGDDVRDDPSRPCERASPPSNERIMKIASVFVFGSMPSQKT